MHTFAIKIKKSVIHFCRLEKKILHDLVFAKQMGLLTNLYKSCGFMFF